MAYKVLCDYLWTLWGVIQHVNENPVEDFWAYAVGRFERCLSEDKLVRFGALNELVEGWVGRRLDTMRLTEEEQQVWEDGFALRRKKGMATMQSMQGAGAYAGLETCAGGAWGACEGEECCLSDVDLSGQVDVSDLVAVILNWS